MSTLSPAQRELLTYIAGGGLVLCVSDLGAYYFRCDNRRSVSATVFALWKRLLVVRRGDSIEITDEGRKALAGSLT